MKKFIFVKRIVTALAFLSLIAAEFAGFGIKAYAEDDFERPLSGYSSMEIVSMMGKGYNIGNTLDATGGKASDISLHETSWGNPVINQDLVDGIAEAGFNVVRIPITWNKHIAKDGDYAIDPKFLERVREVVDYCYADDLFVIINVHHESWVNVPNFDTTYEAIGDKLGALWSQVADYFADYDQRLIFEGMNEPRAAETPYEWTGNAKCYEAINYLDQVFVDAVRGNGKGFNGERALMIPDYAASSSKAALNALKIPEINGAPDPNLIISVHCYSPYEFCLTDSQTTFSRSNSADTADIRRLMGDLQKMFIDNGYPVVIGECGCTNSGDNHGARLEWFDYFGEMSRQYNIPAILWDNGSGGNSGGECHKYFNRKTGELLEQELIEAFIYGKEASPSYLKDVLIDFEPYKEGDSTVLVTPQSVGFLDLKLTKQSKVNHTIGAAVGFSLKVDKGITDKFASMDISRYKGKTIKITAYACSDDKDTVLMGIKTSDGTMTDLYEADTNSVDEWVKFSGTFNMPEEGDTYLYFKGLEDTTYYVDDLSIEMADENGEFASGPCEEKKLITDSPEKTDNSDEGNEAYKGVLVLLIGVPAVVIIVICIILFKNSQKKKSD